MKYTIKFEEDSLTDFLEGVSYYEKISETLANQFHTQFWNTIDLIKEHPLHYQNRYKGIRIAFTEIFPFGIHYIVDENVITVLKILHTKRFFK